MTHRSEAASFEDGRSTITQVLIERARASGPEIGHWTLAQHERWQPHSWSELHVKVAALTQGLVRLGLQVGDRVAFVASGSSDWDLLHWSVLGARGVVVGVDAHAGPVQIDALLELARPTVLVVDRATAVDRLTPDVMAPLRFIVTLHDDAAPAAAGTPPIVALSTLLVGGTAQSTWDTARPDDEAWVVFTSGTTGQPKGVMFRHRQVCSAMEAILDAFGDIAPEARLASWLPLSNPFQRIVNLCAVARGAQTYYVSDPRTVMRHLPSIKPHVFVGVPRFYEKFYAGAMEALTGAGGLRARVARWALRVGDTAAAQRRADASLGLVTRFALVIADALVLRQVRRAFGGQLRYLVSGSAAMPRWLLERLHGMGLLVLEAYGLSECVIPVASNRIGDYRLGTVGHAMKGIETRVAADGELLIRSRGAFDGYLGEPDDVGLRDAEGWLATGDLAHVDDAGFIHLVGRKSEVFKTSTGRRVAPQAVEAALRSIPGVEHAAVFGAGRASLLAFVALAEGFEGSLATLPDAVRRATVALPEHQRPAGLVVTRRALGIETGELTSNLKLRRQVVAERYAAALTTLASAVDTPGGRSGEIRTLESEMLELMLV